MLMSLIASRHSVYVPPLRLDWSTARKGWTWTNPFGVGVVARTLPGAAAVPDGTIPEREVISPDGVHTALMRESDVLDGLDSDAADLLDSPGMTLNHGKFLTSKWSSRGLRAAPGRRLR
jgi:hypothetical protein